MNTFVHRSTLPVSAEDAFAWHAAPGAFERLNPPWEPVEIVAREGGLEGGRVTLRVPAGPLRLEWLAQHDGFVAGRQFRDTQVRGPFAHWVHTHTFIPQSPHTCTLEDRIEYRLPLEPFSRWLAGAAVRAKLERVFAARHRITAQDCAELRRLGLLPSQRHTGPLQELPRVNSVVISGLSGLVGGALAPLLTAAGTRVTGLGRRHGTGNIVWDPASGQLEAAKLEGHDAVIHLAGEPIAGRWSAAKKKAVYDSRILGTKLLCESLARLDRKPQTLLCASAIGFYGHRGNDELVENAGRGTGFLADVAADWEAATRPAEDAGIRVVHLRIGVVLSTQGGALKEMLTPFKLGIAGVLGSGRQYWSWIALDDVLGAILHALHTPTLRGPVNLTAPNPATNREFTQTLGTVLRRPTILPVPAFVLRTLLGEMADELLLSSIRVLPKKLQDTGYVFRYPTLEPALRHLLGR